MARIEYIPKQGLIAYPDGTGINLLNAESIAIKRKVIALTNAAATTKNLTAGDSGALVTINPATAAANVININLPLVSTSAGIWYDFVFLANAGDSGADVNIQSAQTADLMVGILVGAGGGDVNIFDISADADACRLFFDAGESTAMENQVVRARCDGVNWIMHAITRHNVADLGTNGSEHVATENSLV